MSQICINLPSIFHIFSFICADIEEGTFAVLPNFHFHIPMYVLMTLKMNHKNAIVVDGNKKLRLDTKHELIMSSISIFLSMRCELNTKILQSSNECQEGDFCFNFSLFSLPVSVDEK